SARRSSANGHGLGVKRRSRRSTSKIVGSLMRSAIDATIAAASSLDRALGNDDSAAADGDRGELLGNDGHAVPDQARAAHLVSLLDRETVVAVAIAAETAEQTGEGRHRRAGRRILH